MKNLLTSILLLAVSISVSAQDLCFDPAADTRYEAGNAPTAVAKGDFNGDNHLDVVVANYLGHSISIHLGNGDGTFQPQVEMGGLLGPAEDVEVADFNSDNKLDIVVCLRGTSSNLALLTGNGDGTFNAPTYSQLGIGQDQFRKIELADVDDDNMPDIAYNVTDDSLVHIIKTVGDGSFSLIGSVLTSGRSWDISLKDFSGDNVPDLVVTYLLTTPYVSLYTNNGDGSFGAETQLPTNYSGTYADCILARLDLNTDFDLAVHSGGFMMIWQGDGASGFTLMDEINIGSQPDMLMAANLDHAGNNDICWVQGSSQAVETLLDTADFNHAGVSSYNVNGDGKHGVLGDFNEDGEIDIVSACYSDDYITFTQGQADGSFGPYPLRAYGSAVAIAVADFDGDTHLDIVVVTDYLTTSIALMKGNGDGSFQNTISTDITGAGADVVAANVDGDADMDLIIAGSGGRLLVHHNDGNGNFSDEDVYLTVSGGGDQDVAVGDFNFDGWPDAVMSLESEDAFRLFINTQTDSFAAPLTFATGTDPEDIFALALNNDNYDDVVTANSSSNDISVFINNQSGGLLAAVPYVTGGGCRGVTIGLYNNDLFPDIATVNTLDADVSVLLGNGDGTFQAALSNPLAQAVSPISITHGLINGDAYLDLLVVYAIGDEVVLLTGNGDGTFNSPQSYATGDYPSGIALGDFNEDNAMDISTSNRNTNDVSVILNNSAFVTTTGSTQLCEGESVLLSATGGFSYLWSNGETTASINAMLDAIYFVTITNQAGDCAIVPPSVHVTVNEMPTVNLTNTIQAD